MGSIAVAPRGSVLPVIQDIQTTGTVTLGGIARGSECGKVACTSWRAIKAMSAGSGSGAARISAPAWMSFRCAGFGRGRRFIGQARFVVARHRPRT
jgi:hypothetical protein